MHGEVDKNSLSKAVDTSRDSVAGRRRRRMRTSSKWMLIVICSVAMLYREVALIERKTCKDCGGSGRLSEDEGIQ